MRLAGVLAQDLRYATRTLRRSPVFTFSTIVVVALGIAASTAMFALVNAWLLRPLPLERPNELVSVWRTTAASSHEPAYFDLYRDYLIWTAENRTLAALGATLDQEYAVTGTGDPVRVHGEIATWNLFDVVGAHPAAGRLFRRDDASAEPSCVISYALWQSRFGGSRDAIGRSVRLNERPFRVLGVLPQGFSLRVLDRPFDADVWTVILASDTGHTPASLAPVMAVGRLKPGVTAAQAEADLGAIQQVLNRRYADEPRGSGVLVATLQQDNTRTVRTSLLLLMATVVVLLLIACVNAGGLILGRQVERAREFAVRLALGCSVPRLLQQLTTEIMVVFVSGGAIGVALAWVLIHVFVAANPLGVLPPGGISIDKTVLVTTATAVCATALPFGSLPAARALWRLDADALRDRAATPARARVRSRARFVALEIALSVVLLVSAGLLISTFLRIAAEPLGFDTRNVYVTDVALPFSRYRSVEAEARFADNVVARLRALPSVRAASASMSWPFQANGLNPIDVSGSIAAPDQAPQAFTFIVGTGFFDSLGMRIVRGREFTDADGPRSLAVAVVNEAMARRAFAGDDPIGKRVRIGAIGNRPSTDPWLTIVGVVSDARSQRYDHVDWDEEPAVYTSLSQRHDSRAAARGFDTDTLYIYLRTESAMPGAIAAVVHAVDPDLPLGALRTTGDIVGELRAQPRLRASVLGGFALLTLILAIVGVYGVMAQFVGLCRRELGIRIALGATRADVIRLVLHRTFAMVALGLPLGTLGALAAGRLLQGTFYGASARDPLTVSAVLVVLALVSGAASYVPARSAAGIDPNVTLRCE